ncbi:MAG TPA: tRNA threonylcarbamoyladenosine dehydratase [Bacillota bacterium]|nr:tRNA threonylcarbamoyladenosine dehydratase [Bacillota bacterium]
MRFDRFEKLIGKDRLQVLSHQTIAVFGLGGVGSYVVEALARSGIRKLIICDFDRVEITNINRQLIALESTLDQLKTDVVEERIRDINPEATVLSFSVKADETIIRDILAMEPDYVVDAIDDVFAKVTLIKAAIEKDIPIVSSMGFANKLHPEMIAMTTMDKTSVDPLAKVMRKRLKDEGVSLDFQVAYSKETPIKPEVDGVLASSAFCPSVAGLMIAAHVVNHIIGELS